MDKDNNKNIYVTDGQHLAEKVEELVESGVTDVTVNVNTLNYTRYQKSHDGLELHPVIDGINKAVGKKLHIRLAVSLQEGFSDDEILDFLQLTFQHKYDIAFMLRCRMRRSRLKCLHCERRSRSSKMLKCISIPVL